MKCTNFAILFLLTVPVWLVGALERVPGVSSIFIDLDLVLDDYENADGHEELLERRRHALTPREQLLAQCHGFIAELQQIEALKDTKKLHAAFESLCLDVKDFSVENIEQLAKKRLAYEGKHDCLQHVYNELLIKKMQEFADRHKYSSLPMLCKVVDSFEDLFFASSESDDVSDVETEQDVTDLARLRRGRSPVIDQSAQDVLPLYSAHVLAATWLPKDRYLD